MNEERFDFTLDITGEICPMTFVRAKLMVERMFTGQKAEIRLKGREPLTNVPRSLAELGHRIVAVTPEPGQPADGVHRLVVVKA
jgi:TusA-related sulfurtransferase